MESVGIDQETVRDRLIAKEILEDVGGDAYLSAAVAATPHAVHIVDYAHLVHNAYVIRQLGQAGIQINEIGSDYSNTRDVDRAVKAAEEIIFKIGQTYESADFLPIRDARSITEFFDPPTVDDTDESNQPIATGFESLDRVLGGFHRSDMIVLAARPGFGKSTLALNVGLNAAKNGKTVGIFSLEMGIDQVAHRMAAAHARINIQNVRNDHLTPAERDRLSDAYGYLSDMRIYVDDAALQTASALSAKARRLKLQAGLDFLIVDYMQLISGSSSGGREANRVQEVSEIFPLPESDSPRSQHSRTCLFTAEPSRRATQIARASTRRPARVWLHRTRCRRRHVHPPRRQEHVGRRVEPTQPDAGLSSRLDRDNHRQTSARPYSQHRNVSARRMGPLLIGQRTGHGLKGASCRLNPSKASL